MKINVENDLWKISVNDLVIHMNSNNVFEVKENLLGWIEDEFNREIIRLIELGAFNKYK